MEIIKRYNDALQTLYDSVGFVEDWTVYAVADRTEMFWKVVDGDKVRFAETVEKMNELICDYYEDEIYKQRFYKKHIYRGDDLTMIIVDTHTDGNKFFAFYDNEKELNKDYQ
jgi:hypothetical protein